MERNSKTKPQIILEYRMFILPLQAQLLYMPFKHCASGLNLKVRKKEFLRAGFVMSSDL